MNTDRPLLSNNWTKISKAMIEKPLYLQNLNEFSSACITVKKKRKSKLTLTGATHQIKHSVKSLFYICYPP